MDFFLSRCGLLTGGHGGGTSFFEDHYLAGVLIRLCISIIISFRITIWWRTWTAIKFWTIRCHISLYWKIDILDRRGWNTLSFLLKIDLRYLCDLIILKKYHLSTLHKLCGVTWTTEMSSLSPMRVSNKETTDYYWIQLVKLCIENFRFSWTNPHTQLIQA